MGFKEIEENTMSIFVINIASLAIIVLMVILDLLISYQILTLPLCVIEIGRGIISNLFVLIFSNILLYGKRHPCGKKKGGVTIFEFVKNLTKWKKALTVISVCLISFLLLSLFAIFNINKPISIYFYKFTKKLIYLKPERWKKYDTMSVEKQDKQIILNNKKIITNFWIRLPFHNDERKYFDKIFLFINYEKGTDFKNENAMLKIELNDNILIPYNTKSIIDLSSGSSFNNYYLTMQKGAFFYNLKEDYLSEENVFTITLEKAILNDFTFEFALFKSF